MRLNVPDPERLKLGGSMASRLLAARKNALPRPRRGKEFLAGQIPLAWLCKAAKLPGKGLAVGLAIWFKARCQRSRTVLLTRTTLAKLGVERKSGYRGLQVLERAELVMVDRHIGRSPIVTLLDSDALGQGE